MEAASLLHTHQQVVRPCATDTWEILRKKTAVICYIHFGLSAVVDLRGARGTPPPRSEFFQFHAVFGKIWQNRMLAPH